MRVPGFETSYQMLTFVYWIGFIRARVIIFSVSTSPDDGTHGREGDDLGIPMIHNEVRKIRRWRSVIADWFSSNFEIWFIIAAWILGGVTCQMFYWSQPIFWSVDPSWSSGSSSSCNYFLVAHADAWHWHGWMVGVGQIGGMVVRYITVKGDVIPKNHLVVTSNDWRKENIGNCVASITPVFQQKTQVGTSHCN